MAFDYEAAKRTATNVILKYGAAGQVIKKGVTEGFDDSGNATGSTSDVIIHGLITPLVLYTTKEIDGTSIISGDSWVYFQSEAAPDVGMQVTLNSVTLRVTAKPSVVSVGGIVLYYKLQLRS